MSRQTRVLHVDDDAGFASLTASTLEATDGGFEVVVETTAGDALDRLADADGAIDCIVSDYEMPGTDGLEFLRAVRSDHPDLPFVLFTGKGSEEVASDAFSAGATDYLQKGPDIDQFELLAKRIENAVSRWRARTDYRRIFEDATDGITVHDPDTGEILDVNRRFCEMIGYDRDDLLSETIDAFSATARGYTQARVRERIALAREEGEQVFEWVLETAAGDDLPIEVRLKGTTLRGQDCVLAVARDVSERKARERELERYEQIVGAVGDAVFELDDRGVFTEVNDYMAEILGYEVEGLVGEHLTAVVTPEDLAAARESQRRLLAGEVDYATFELTARTADGEPIACEVRTALAPERAGTDRRGTVGVVRDVTDRKERERELERQNQRLEEFASIVSHDLKSPLTVAKGRIGLAEADCDSDDLEIAAATLDRMESLIDRTLTLAREGRTVGETQPTELSAVAEAAWSTAGSPDADLRLRDLPAVEADPDRLRHLFENLYGNAVEHGAADAAVTVGALEDGEGGFYVADDGPGIPRSERDSVLEAGYTTTQSGTGLGLAIVRRIAEAHGWTVDVTESDGGGARFEFTDVDPVG